MPATDAVTVKDDRALDVCCIVCGNRQFLASLLLPGGLRLKCTACGKSYGDGVAGALIATLAGDS